MGYSVNIFTLASGRYGKDIAATPERQRKVLDKLGLDDESFQRETGLPINAYTGAELQGYLLNGKRGIAGFLDRFHEGRDAQGGRVDGSQDRGRESSGQDVSFAMGQARMADVSRSKNGEAIPIKVLSEYRDLDTMRYARVESANAPIEAF